MIFILVVLCVLIALALWWLSRRIRSDSGLPEGRLIYSDTSTWTRNDQPILSRRYGIVGKPDYLVRDGNQIVPVEIKATRKTPTTPHRSHILQLAAYCLLVEDNYGVRPNYGIVLYGDKQFAVEYTDALRNDVLRAAESIRADANSPDVERNHSDAVRCAACGLNHACDERLA